MRRGRFLVTRTAYAALTIFVAITVNFLLFRAMPGNAVSNVARIPNASPQLERAVRKEFGLDQSLWQQYVKYLEQLAHGNLGISFETQQPVATELRTALLHTLPLVGVGTFIAITLGVVSGVLSGWLRGSKADTANTAVAILLFSLPIQWFGLLLIAAFGGLLPPGGMSDPFLVNPSFGEQVLDYARHLVLPAGALALALYGQYVLIVRSSMIETLGEDYILTARAKGLPTWLILRRHALRNALLPTTTLIALSIGYLVAGSILIETVFSWPGIGRAVFEAVGQRDYPMLQGAFLLLAISVVLANYLADLVYFKLDPRITG